MHCTKLWGWYAVGILGLSAESPRPKRVTPYKGLEPLSLWQPISMPRLTEIKTTPHDCGHWDAWAASNGAGTSGNLASSCLDAARAVSRRWAFRSSWSCPTSQPSRFPVPWPKTLDKWLGYPA